MVGAYKNKKMMMIYMLFRRCRFGSYAFFLLLILMSCSKQHEFPSETSTPEATVKALVKIEWMDESAKKISHDTYNAEYPRIRRISKDTLFLVYRSGPNQENSWDNIALRKSFDNGETWQPVEIIAQDTDPNYFGFSDPELLVLKNGWILVAYEGRGNPDTNERDNIQVRVSKNRGKTWSLPIVVAKGRSWEPAMIQLPDGEVELFFSSEAKWWPSPEPRPQEILLVRSEDNGLSWTEPQTVSFTENTRDGMPSPLLLNNNEMVFAIENVGLARSPWVISSSLAQRWNYSDLPTVQNGRRWRAVSEEIHGGAPYLIQLPTGETLLSCHLAGGRSVQGWRKNTMAVYIGDQHAKNFRDRSYPWPNLPVNEGAIFNSLFLKDAYTVVALSSRIFADGHGEIYWKEGNITFLGKENNE